MRQRIFVDMDGVLARFSHVDTLETLYRKGYFLDLKPIKPVVDAMREIVLSQRKTVYILSAYLSDSQYALEEKNEWLDRYLPEVVKAARLFPPCGVSKIKWLEENGYMIEKSDVLLDDYSKNLHEWQEKGTGIKLLNGINGNHGTWAGKCVSTEDPDIFENLILGMESCLQERETIRQIKLTDELEV